MGKHLVCSMFEEEDENQEEDHKRSVMG